MCPSRTFGRSVRVICNGCVHLRIPRCWRRRWQEIDNARPLRTIKRLAEDSIMQEKIEIGYQVFVSDGGEEVGAVREVSPNGKPEIVVYVENSGDFFVPLSAVEAVH